MNGLQLGGLALSVVVSFAVCLVVGPILIPILQRLKFGQTVRDDGPQTHLKKAGTPTMGGIMIFIAIGVACAFLTEGSLEIMGVCLLITFGYGLLGFLDDFISVKMKRSLGLRPYQKLIGQFGLALILALFAYNSELIGSRIYVPILNQTWDLGVFYIPITMLLVVFMTNSVNLTDGLDGLASGVTVIASVTFGIVFVSALYAIGFGAQNSALLFEARVFQPLLIFSGAVTGACLGFLRFNAYPARVIMGDTGSLALGAAVSVMAVLSGMMLLLPLICGMFVASSVSVILQVGSYKLRKKRIFKMAPLHHHFELSGMPETKIVSMYMLVTAALCFLALILLQS